MGPAAGGSEGRGRLGESDLLAERRARRAAESGEVALTRRAEAAEATVQTLERHVSSLQQRLREADEDRRRVAELIEEEKDLADERDNELRRVKQREYAEQQLRVEAEERLLGLERESHLETERLGLRLGEAERETRELSQRLEGLERQLAEAEQASGAQRAALGRAEQGLQARVDELERRAREIQHGLQGEREARERSERSLEGIREGHRRMEGLLGEVKGIVARLGSALTSPRREPAAAPKPVLGVLPAAPAARAGEEQRGLEMADALAAAVERLRARAESAAEAQGREAPHALEQVELSAAAGASKAVPAEAVEAAATPASEASQMVPDAPAPALGDEIELTAVRPTHKHSLSLIRRIGNRRKQRRGR